MKNYIFILYNECVIFITIMLYEQKKTLSIMAPILPRLQYVPCYILYMSHKLEYDVGEEVENCRIYMP